MTIGDWYATHERNHTQQRISHDMQKKKNP